MLGKVRDAIRVQKALANKGMNVTPLEAYDSWVRYSLSNDQGWIEIRKNEKDETIYRKVRRHVTSVDENVHLIKVKDKVEEKLISAVRDLDAIGKQEIQKVIRYRNLIFSFPTLAKSTEAIKH